MMWRERENQKIGDDLNLAFSSFSHAPIQGKNIAGVLSRDCGTDIRQAVRSLHTTDEYVECTSVLYSTTRNESLEPNELAFLVFDRLWDQKFCNLSSSDPQGWSQEPWFGSQTKAAMRPGWWRKWSLVQQPNCVCRWPVLRNPPKL